MTPDSFFDGGRYLRPQSAGKQAEKMVREGADILDVGGESSRPGAAAVSLEEELQRVVPTVRQLARRFPQVAISVDTRKSEVAVRCLAEGAKIVNDISALNEDKRMIRAVREFGANIVLMHMRGRPETMQKNPRYSNVLREVKNFLQARVRWAILQGIPREKIWVDPGIGFGKTTEHNLQLLRGLKEFGAIGCPVLVGCSRKSFLGKIVGNGYGGGGELLPPEDRLEGSLAAACWSFLNGASILRVHDVGATRKAIGVIRAIFQATKSSSQGTRI